MMLTAVVARKTREALKRKDSLQASPAALAASMQVYPSSHAFPATVRLPGCDGQEFVTVALAHLVGYVDDEGLLVL